MTFVDDVTLPAILGRSADGPPSPRSHFGSEALLDVSR